MIVKSHFVRFSGVLILFVLFYAMSLAHGKATRSLWIGELWHTDEDDASGGWERCFAWPGNHWREKLVGEVCLMNECARSTGFGYGMKNWKEYTGTTYPYVVGNSSASQMVHAPGKYAIQPLEMKLILRRETPKTVVDGVEQAPRQSYDEIDPNLVSDAVLWIRYSWEVGITADIKIYAYSCHNADSYFYFDVHMINNGNAIGDERRLEYRNQVLHDVCFKDRKSVV